MGLCVVQFVPARGSSMTIVGVTEMRRGLKDLAASVMLRAEEHQAT